MPDIRIVENIEGDEAVVDHYKSLDGIARRVRRLATTPRLLQSAVSELLEIARDCEKRMSRMRGETPDPLPETANGDA